jgi:hypothetical protein
MFVSYIDAFLEGIEARFDNLVQREELILVSMVHPQFSVHWMKIE